VAGAIRRAYRRLGGSVAVRSSMVGEDSAHASFAGQLGTSLHIGDEGALLAAIRHCWASVFSTRLLSYWAHRQASAGDLLPERLAIAVIVQRMVDARAAGVAFTADPLTGENAVVIEATAGLADRLVQGLCDPQRYVIDPRGVLIRSTLPEGIGSPALDEETVLHVARLVRRIHRYMGEPQDVEWAWDGQDLLVLQSRPITSLTGRRVYSDSLVSDMLPGYVKPLVWSISATSMLEDVLGRVFTALIGPNDIRFRDLARRFYSRIYADQTLLGELLDRMGLPANFFETMSRDEQADHRTPMSISSRTIVTLARMARFAIQHGWNASEVKAYIDRHDQELDSYRSAEWSQAEDAVLWSRTQQLRRLYSETLWYNFVGPMNTMLRTQLLILVARRWASDVSSADLMWGLAGRRSLVPDREIRLLAQLASRLDDRAISVLSHGDDIEIRSVLSASEPGQELLARFDAFLLQFGFLSANGTDLSQTPWIENPTIIWRAIARGTLHGQGSAPLDHQEIRDNARTRVRAKLGWVHRIIFDRLIAGTSRYLALREHSSALISEDSYQLRRLFLALGDRFVSRDMLTDREDVFYLALDELQDLLDGRLEPATARERVVLQRHQMSEHAKLELPHTFCGEPRPVALSELQYPGATYLSGIAGSPGQVEGLARIIQDPLQDTSTLSVDDILIVPFTDVSWTPLFTGIAGLVAETGGQLSHSAIVAREHGLPAVVNVKNATRVIQEGQRIAVDGDQGRVYLG
jgi:phosphohistidine swiveling domain-containing protein